MKRFSLMIAAIMLLVGFTQCKKDNETPTTDQGVRITLTAGYGQNGGKTDFDPADLEHAFVWSSGTEYINVGGSTSGYLGCLEGTGNGSSTAIPFSGELDKTPEDGETLFFFYLGNGNHAGANSIDFSNQNGTNVTNCHIAIGSDTYTTGKVDFNAKLEMAMAIAKFDLSAFNDGGSKTQETVYLSGNDVYSTAAINYNTGTITGNSKGQVKVGTAGEAMYVALIPSVSGKTTLQFNSKSKTGSIEFQNGIKKGKYYSNAGAALAIAASAGSGIPGVFSVSASQKVFFSKGNLQYQASTGTWQFAEHQYDAIGNAAGNTTVTDRDRQSDWIDLFGWGTSGWNNGNSNYQPYNHYYTSTSNAYGYGPKNGYNYSIDLTGDYDKADWGVYNNISNGGTGWRTLTGGDDTKEWNYLLKTRSASTINGVENARYARATVNGVNGIVIFPDIYTHPDGVSLPINTTINSSDGWGSNIYDGNNWVKMENAGAVFLPVTGRRNAEATTINDIGIGYYWSVNCYSNNSKYYACSMVLQSKNLDTSNKSQFRYYGLAVRLVKDVE